MKREEINKAILDVIKEKDGRRNRKARELVKEAGYTPYERFAGCFFVLNKGTGKQVTFSDFERPDKVDFVGYLNTVENTAYEEAQKAKDACVGRREDRKWYLMCRRQRIEWNNEYAEDAKKQIEKCLNRIKELNERLVDYKVENMKAEQEIKDALARWRKGA